MKLKTLKDFECNNICIYDDNGYIAGRTYVLHELRKVAIQHIKELEKHQDESAKGSMVHRYWFIDGKISWIKEFFNIKGGD